MSQKKPLSAEAEEARRKKISEAAKKRWQNAEFKAKASDAMKARKYHWTREHTINYGRALERRLEQISKGELS